MLKTAIIYRPFMWFEVKQDIDTMFYNATEVLKAYNKTNWKSKQIDEYLSNKTTKDFINQLVYEESLNTGKSRELENQYSPINTKRWKFGWTWMHSKLLLDMMMWLSPEFKSKAYDFILEWFQLAWKRNELKEWFKKMTKAISESWSCNYREEATMINVLCTWSCASNQRSRLWIDKMQQMDELQITNASLIKAGLSLEERKNILAKSL
jgi:hypothetical protein